VLGVPEPARNALPSRANARLIANAAVFTAFVAAATSFFSVFIPATTGYFNVGEVMVYTTALLMGPLVGAFAGGVGSAIADLALGYWYFSPGTLVIKGVEGFIVGYLSKRVFASTSVVRWRMTTVGIGLVLALVIGYVGTAFLSGEQQVSAGLSNPSNATIGPWTIGPWALGPQFSADIVVPQVFWVGLSVAVFALVVFFGTRVEPRLGSTILSVLIGGTELVVGYFLYETVVLRYLAPSSVIATIFPVAEIPFNIAQVLIGLLVAIPLTRSVMRASGWNRALEPGKVPART